MKCSKQLLMKAFQMVMPYKLIMFNGHTSNNSIALTFDDGPYPANTEKILRILREHNIKATFFMNGKAIEKHKDTFMKVLSEGHEIGNHLYNHSHVTNLSYKDLNKEMEVWGEVLEQVVPGNGFPKIFRPPYGSLDLKTFWYAWRRGWTIVLWSLNSNDLADISLEDNLRSIELLHIKAGDIVLFHEDSRHIEGLLEWVIQKARNQGYTFNKVSEITS